MTSTRTVFPPTGCTICVLAKKSLPTPRSKRLSPMFSLRSSTVRTFTFRFKCSSTYFREECEVRVVVYFLCFVSPPFLCRKSAEHMCVALFQSLHQNHAILRATASHGAWESGGVRIPHLALFQKCFDYARSLALAHRFYNRLVNYYEKTLRALTVIVLNLQINLGEVTL